MSVTKLSKGRFKLFLNIITLPVYLITFLIPKDKNLIVLGSSRGWDIADNSKYLFMYFKQIERKKRLRKYYFITKNKRIYAEIKGRGENNVLYLFTLKGMLTLIRARHVVLTHSLDDLMPFLYGGKVIHQLWHGTPLKKIGFDADNWGKSKARDIFKNLTYKLIPYQNYMHCNFLYVSSEYVKSSMSTAFRLKDECIKPLGQPRNNYLLNLTREYPLLQSENTNFGEYKKIVSWLPTHRGFSGKSIIDILNEYGFNTERFDGKLKDKGYLFVIKPHFVERANLKEHLKGYTNILVYDEVDPYPLIKDTDILITDYSSILFDYLLLDRTAIFAPFDYDFYVNNVAELYYNYDDIAYGSIAYDWESIFNLIFENEDSVYAEKRKRLIEEFCAADRDSAEKISDFIDSLNNS
ncbi:hypothetical protein ASE46_02560 [Bacillus sp. Root239]|nr:hypothetical protein ASE46_02560 [Bacillus sp. Root239]